MVVVETSELTKVYASGDGIWGINIEVEKGDIFGFLGANGAGKTTAIRVLLGLLYPTAGKVRVLGEDPLKKAGILKRREIGYLPGELALYEECTGQELLDFFASSKGEDPKDRSRVMEAISFASSDLKRKVREYSRGMKQKLGIIITLQHRPRVVFMDEPTTGLDPLIQLEIYRLLQGYAADGGTVFMSSHNLAEVEKVCNRVAIIRQGKLVALEEVEKLRRHRVYSIEFTMDIKPQLEQLEKIGLKEADVLDGLIRGKISGDLDEFLRKLLKVGKVEDLNCSRGRLEDIFLEYYQLEEENTK